MSVYVVEVEQRSAENGLEACQPSAGVLLPRYSRISWATLALGLVLFLAGAAGINSAQSSADTLARNGVRATAIVTNYWPDIRGSAAHISVSYSTPNGAETNVTVWTNDVPSYRIGQPVQISYDSSDPTRAVLTKGDSAGSTASVYLGIFFFGLALVLVAIRRFRARRRCRRALAEQATSAG